MWWHQRKELAQSYNKLVLDLEEKQKNIAHLQQQLGNMKQQNDLQFKQVNELRQVREMQRKALGQLHLKQQQLENQLTTAHTQMETLQQEQRDRERQREQEQGKLRWAESREVNARKEKETLVERIAVLQTELTKNATTYLQTQLTAAHAQIQTLQQEQRDRERQREQEQGKLRWAESREVNARKEKETLVERM
jgi:chromosome segregation ATPase